MISERPLIRGTIKSQVGLALWQQHAVMLIKLVIGCCSGVLIYNCCWPVVGCCSVMDAEVCLTSNHGLAAPCGFTYGFSFLDNFSKTKYNI